MTDEELDDIRTKCESRAKAHQAGRRAVKTTSKKAKRAADDAAA